METPLPDFAREPRALGCRGAPPPHPIPFRSQGSTGTGSITDVRTSPMVPDHCRERVLADRVVSLLGIPLLKEGRLVGALAVSMTTPREWTPAEIDRSHAV